MSTVDNWTDLLGSSISQHEPPESYQTLSTRSTSPSPPSYAQSSSVTESDVGYVYSDDMLHHASIHGHPEAPERITVIRQELEDQRLLRMMTQIPIRHAKRSEVLLVHSADLWDKVEAIQRELSIMVNLPFRS